MTTSVIAQLHTVSLYDTGVCRESAYNVVVTVRYLGSSTGPKSRLCIEKSFLAYPCDRFNLVPASFHKYIAFNPIQCEQRAQEFLYSRISNNIIY